MLKYLVAVNLNDTKENALFEFSTKENRQQFIDEIKNNANIQYKTSEVFK